jgi:hypothetical protein
MADADTLEGTEIEDTDEQEQYLPPDTLPPPLPASAGGFGAIAGPLIVALCISLVVGVAMFAIGQLVYVYILFNWAAGAAIAWPLAKAPEKGYLSKGALFVAVLGCSVLVYLVFNIAMYVYVIGQAGGAEGFGFIDFLLVRAEQEPVINDLKPGVVGNFIVWAIELGITVYYAWHKVSAAVVVGRFQSVPTEVTSLVIYYQGEGLSEVNVRSELSTRGWTRMEDQDRAFDAAGALSELAVVASE